jgi:SAM-dependent methyltransferase
MSEKENINSNIKNLQPNIDMGNLKGNDFYYRSKSGGVGEFDQNLTGCSISSCGKEDLSLKGMMHFEKPMQDYFKFADDLSKVFSINLAIRFRIFDYLEEMEKGQSSARGLLEKMKFNTPARHFVDLLDELFIHGYLEREGVMDQAIYKNSEYTRTYFIKTSPENYSFIYHNLYRYIQKFDQLDNNMPKGKTIKYSDDIYNYENDTKAYYSYYYKVNEPNFDNLINKCDFSKFRKVMDIHGGKGLLAMKIKQKFPLCDLISFENVKMKQEAEVYLKGNQMHESVCLQYGDLISDKLPTVDCVIAPHILMHYSCDNKNKVATNIYNCLNPNGELLIMENFLETRDKDSHGLKVGFMLGMLGYEGSTHSFEEYKTCLTHAGFKSFDYVENGHGLSNLIIARK